MAKTIRFLVHMCVSWDDLVSCVTAISSANDFEVVFSHLKLHRACPGRWIELSSCVNPSCLDDIWIIREA